MVTGRTKGLTYRGKGNVVLVAAQREGADGTPSEEYILLRADEFGRLRTVGSGGGGAGTNDLRMVKGLGAERWSTPGWYNNAQANFAAVAGEMVYIPILVPQTRTYIRIGTFVQIAGAGATVARLGIYNAQLDSDGLTPSTLLLDAGTVLTDAAVAVEAVISQSLVAATWYFLCIVTDGTPTLRGFDGARAVSVPVSGFGTDLDNGTNGDYDKAVLTTAAVGVGALADPAVAPTNVDEGSLAGFVRLRDV